MPGEWRGWGRAGGAPGHWPGFPGLPRWMLTLTRGRSGVIGGASSPRRRRRRHGLIPHRASPEPSGPVGCCLRDWEEEGTRQGQGVGAAGAEGSWSCPGLGMCLCWGGGLKPREWQSLYFPCEAGEAEVMMVMKSASNEQKQMLMDIVDHYLLLFLELRS